MFSKLGFWAEIRATAPRKPTRDFFPLPEGLTIASSILASQLKKKFSFYFPTYLTWSAYSVVYIMLRKDMDVWGRIGTTDESHWPYWSYIRDTIDKHIILKVSIDINHDFQEPSYRYPQKGTFIKSKFKLYHVYFSLIQTQMIASDDGNEHP